MKQRTIDRINKFLKLYMYFIVLPSGAFLGCFNAFYFFTQPEIFVYQRLDPHCVGFSCAEPLTAEGVSVLGIKVSDPFLIPILNEEEFREKERFMDKINFWSFTSMVLLFAGFVYDQRKVFKDAFGKKEF